MSEAKCEVSEEQRKARDAAMCGPDSHEAAHSVAENCLHPTELPFACVSCIMWALDTLDQFHASERVSEKETLAQESSRARTDALLAAKAVAAEGRCDCHFAPCPHDEQGKVIAFHIQQLIDNPPRHE